MEVEVRVQPLPPAIIMQQLPLIKREPHLLLISASFKNQLSVCVCPET
jgi:hypothetical protein